jgi:hypothetical protein
MLIPILDLLVIGKDKMSINGMGEL